MARLDAAMVQQGLVPSRQRAKTLIQNGQISVNGKVCTKPAFAVEETDQITMEGSDIPFVGRGGLKLEYALEQPADFFSVDVSFISLHHVLPYVLPLLKPDAAGAILIKPQFEAGRENIGKNGLVQSQRVHVQVLGNILTLLSALGLTVQLLCPSPIRGGSGNVEYLAAVQKGGETAYVPDAAAVVQQAFTQAKKEKTK